MRQCLPPALPPLGIGQTAPVSFRANSHQRCAISVTSSRLPLVLVLVLLLLLTHIVVIIIVLLLLLSEIR